MRWETWCHRTWERLRNRMPPLPLYLQDQSSEILDPRNHGEGWSKAGIPLAEKDQVRGDI